VTEPTPQQERTLGGELRRLRKERGLSQKAAGDLLGVSVAYVSQVELGHKWLGQDQLRRYVEALGVPGEFPPLFQMGLLEEGRFVVDLTALPTDEDRKRVVEACWPVAKAGRA
jgi:transcriptional regulator with XRE-family HTH domain